jgi:endonuclease YncB( thermonuclease family)
MKKNIDLMLIILLFMCFTSYQAEAAVSQECKVVSKTKKGNKTYQIQVTFAYGMEIAKTSDNLSGYSTFESMDKIFAVIYLPNKPNKKNAIYSGLTDTVKYKILETSLKKKKGIIQTILYENDFLMGSRIQCSDESGNKWELIPLKGHKPSSDDFGLARLRPNYGKILLTPPENQDFSGVVTNIIDGDTIEVSANGKNKKIRLYGIDCPELAQPYGQEAKNYTYLRAIYKTVKVRYIDLDNYGRILAYIILPDGSNLNQEIVKAGYAWRYFNSNDPKLGQLESEARASGSGLWSDYKPTPPWEWRKQ